MHGIVSLLPQPYYKEVQNIWDDLEKEVGLTGVKVTPYPHFTWQIGEAYDFPRLERILEDISKSTKPFKIKTTGVGLFTGERPVIFIPVVKDETLLRFHYSIWDKLKQSGEGISEYYNPHSWIPHISLAYEDVTKKNISLVMEKLSFIDFNWSFEVDNISFIYEPSGQIGEIKYRYDLIR